MNIVAVPGAGKTTIIDYITKNLYNKDTVIVTYSRRLKDETK